MNKTLKHKIILLKQQKSKKNKQKGGVIQENTSSNQNNASNVNQETNLDKDQNQNSSNEEKEDLKNTNVEKEDQNVDNENSKDSNENSKDSNEYKDNSSNVEKEDLKNTNVEKEDLKKTNVEKEDLKNTNVEKEDQNLDKEDIKSITNTNVDNNSNVVNEDNKDQVTIITNEDKEDKQNTKKDFTIISSNNTEYPKDFIGFTVLLNTKDLKDFMEEMETESNFINDENKVDLNKLDKQLLNDLKNQITFVNKTNILDTFKEQLKNTSFVSQLFELQPLANMDFLFKESLLNTFTKLNVDDTEINAISTIALDSLGDSSALYYWAIIPYFDEIININGITMMDLINNIKILSLQNSSKNMLDNLIKYVTPEDIFYQSLTISKSFTNFGTETEMKEQINTSLNINIEIENKKDVIITNKQYYSILAPPYEFGLAVINSCLYFDFITNQYFVMWKIDHWRNLVIKNYYQMIIDFFNKKTPVPQELMESMQSFIYNNLISDSYPLTHKNLLEYYYIILAFQKEDLKNKDISSINDLVDSEIKKETLDKDISLLITNEITTIKTSLDIPEDTKLPTEEDSIKEDSMKEDSIKEDSMKEDSIKEDSKKEDSLKEDSIKKEDSSKEDSKKEDSTKEISQTNTQEGESIINNDMSKIEDAKENLNNAYQNYDEDKDKIQNNESTNDKNTNNLTSKLATVGSIGALGAIGTGLYFALPLLLGGSRKKRHKSVGKKTISKRK